MKRFLTLFLLLLALPAAASTLDGRVTDTDGNPLQGVPVSDGYSIVQTDADGCYTICSLKDYGIVFVIVPSGYEAPLDGVFPQFWQPLCDDDVDEVHDFTLRKTDNEDYSLLVLGDLHLCNRVSLRDMEQFRVCMDEIEAQTAAREAAGRKTYVIQLGDMTWDLYWDNSSGLEWCNFDLEAYRRHINSCMAHPVPFFHTMGNHDNDYRAVGDAAAEVPYKKTIGPTYYSFNLGKIHYIVLDDVICTNNGTVDGRGDRMGLTDAQIDWVKADMSFVPDGTPVIVALHEQVYRLDSADKGHEANDDIVRLNAAIGKSHRIHYITGDTHIINNFGRPSDRISEHNAGAVCGAWWWSGRLSWKGVFPQFDRYRGKEYLMVSRDGAPAGYTIYEVDGTDWTSIWKGFGLPEDRQIHTYDLNEVEINSETFPGKGDFARTIDKDAADYAVRRSDNTVLLNVWNYDPSWKIVVKEVETGRKLRVRESPSTFDPMTLVTYNAGRYAEGGRTTGSFKANRTMHHIFKVKATRPDTTLEITVTDGYGRTFRETMTRPKAFTLGWE